jgi:DNA-binding PadR family transcriptional regulator
MPKQGDVMSDKAQPPPTTPEELSEKEFVLLGLIVEEPSHAYAMETKIRDRGMPVWTEIGFSSIYRVLDKLENRGLIDASLVHEGRGATRKVHKLTPEGHRAFVAGVEARLGAARRPKDPAAVAFMYVTVLPHATLVDVLSKRLEQTRAGAEHLALATEAARLSRPLPHVHAACEAAPPIIPPPHLQLLFERGRRHIDAERAFLEDTIETLSGEAGLARYEEWKEWLDASVPAGSERAEGDEG